MNAMQWVQRFSTDEACKQWLERTRWPNGPVCPGCRAEMPDAASQKEKLQDLHEKCGIKIVEVNAAYSSQECSGCGYVDKRNRTEEKFRCLWCGKMQHADVNASRNQRARCSRPAVGSVTLTKAGVLRVLVRQHTERWYGLRGRSGDPRLSNPYFREWAAGVILNGHDDTPATAVCASGP